MYLIRLDDATEHWEKENWHRMHSLLQNYGVKPIVAIIPNNEDPALLQLPLDSDYDATIAQWIHEGWMPALHGYNHVYSQIGGGINPVNQRSEFVGLPIEVQQKKIREGLEILKQKDIDPKIFIAPAHTFDENTIEALRSESSIRIISDTVAKDCYKKNGFYYIPQQAGVVREIHLPLVTFCYHPNTLTDKQFNDLEGFLTIHHEEFRNFNRCILKERNKSFADTIISCAYFLRRKIIRK